MRYASHAQLGAVVAAKVRARVAVCSVSGSSMGPGPGLPRGTDKGWELQGAFTSPFLGDVEDADAPIEFGKSLALLGGLLCV